ncbi:MAG: FAD-dependent oxidoreductase [candidate division NC10 bacterium]|nr:FAD-dependent oxidoreductase [candidate division NC10 bacterium]
MGRPNVRILILGGGFAGLSVARSLERIFAREEGVEVRLATAVAAASAEEVVLQGGEAIPTRTLIWTAGIAPNPFLETLPCPKDDRGRIIVDDSLEVPGYPGIWALGDSAHIPDPRTDRPYPPTAQHAVREAKVVAQNIAASIRGGAKQPFRYSPLGVLAGLGRRSAIAEILGLKFSGFFAWWLWRTIYLFKLPGFERKVRVALDWTLDLFFPRDIVHLRAFMKPAVPQEAPDDEPVSGRAEKRVDPAEWL